MTKVALRSPSGTVNLNLIDPADHISRVIIKGRTWYESDLLNDLKKRVRPGVAIDVGAHIGNHTLFMAAHGFTVSAFEPNPSTYEQLAGNVGLNPRIGGKVLLHPAAVGREFGTGTVFSPNLTNSGMAYVDPDDHGDTPIVPLDSIEFAGRVRVIKIDVEGHEIDVLEGARGILNRDHPVLYVEASTAERRERVDAFLAPYGYELKGRFGKTDTWCYEATVPKQEPTTRTLSIALMAHPKREEMTVALRDELHDQGANPKIVWDQINDRWDTGRRSLLEGTAMTTHHLVLQDDAVIPNNFVSLVESALAIPPDDSPMCLYTGKAISRRLRTMRERRSWLTMPGINWGVGLVIPTHHIEKLVAFGDKRREENYDMRVGRFYQAHKWEVWYPQPSLVQHRRTPSLVEGRGGGRQAHSWVGADGKGFDPNGTVVPVRWSR